MVQSKSYIIYSISPHQFVLLLRGTAIQPRRSYCYISEEENYEMTVSQDRQIMVLGWEYDSGV